MAVAGIMAVIALVHLLRLGTFLHGALFTLYYSYFSDIVVPFGIASFTEVMQAFGVPLLGRTFDPLDIAMFGVGVALAVGLDAAILPRVLPGWRGATTEPAVASGSGQA